MTWARCVCGGTRFELGFDNPVPLKGPSRELEDGPTCLVCGQCGKSYHVSRHARHPKAHGTAESPMISLETTGHNKLDPLLQQVERTVIRQALEKTKGNRSQAAAIIGLSRSRFYRRLEALGIIDGD